jgi:hypothetical protein
MYKKECACGQKTAEIFFGNMILDQSVIVELNCPACSGAADGDDRVTIRDNGWVLELDPDIMAVYAPRMQLDKETVTAEQVFDGDFVTWVGFTPEDNQRRALEREEIMQRTAGDKRAQFEAMKHWAIEREKKFVQEGWRKALRSRQQAA